MEHFIIATPEHILASNHSTQVRNMPESAPVALSHDSQVEALLGIDESSEPDIESFLSAGMRSRPFEREEFAVLAQIGMQLH